jgi:hypothetical protein
VMSPIGMARPRPAPNLLGRGWGRCEATLRAWDAHISLSEDAGNHRHNRDRPRQVPLQVNLVHRKASTDDDARQYREGLESASTSCHSRKCKYGPRRGPRVLGQGASGPLAFFHASMPPSIWQAAVRPASCAACTAMAERSPKAQ